MHALSVRNQCGFWEVLGDTMNKHGSFSASGVISVTYVFYGAMRDYNRPGHFLKADIGVCSD